ncbi:MAG: alanine--tRNA ligase [Deltaproteobacteria bacterium]
MRPLSSSEIRRLFLEFFAGRGHEIVPSSSLVPHDDPTLLFTNAGMVQFKHVFLGDEHRPYSRAASCQKCVRAGGKHNDLENVGYTARHHTFFEMLGNFSFGDYFKREAISYAWEFLTRVLELPPDRLWVTVFQDDDEAADLWREVAGVLPERIVRLGEKDNFWAMGDTGPCGPCSEIIYDQGPETGCGSPDCAVGCDCDRFLEIWNLVFMQFFRNESGDISPLPRKSIDTGMGLERIAAVCQGKTNNFDADAFRPLIEAVERLSGRSYAAGGRDAVAMRVISDHARAAAFLVADGVVPSNEGRGYVLRRIMRRAVRYGRVLGLERPFLAKVCLEVVRLMSDVYPELAASQGAIEKMVTHEETRFGETLEFGLRLLEEEIARLRVPGNSTPVISGAFAFRLYDTYGFPVDIVQDVAREEGLDLDRDGFERAMAEQKARSRSAHRQTTLEEIPEVYRRLAEGGGGAEFVGYETLQARSEIMALVADAGRSVDRAATGWKGELVASRTPFYPESGGQVGDTGEIVSFGGRAVVHDTIKRGDLIVHIVEVVEGELRAGEEAELRVLEGRRLDTARNHTATHLLHAALREVLGDHVKQAGSSVGPQRLRFDFTHLSALSPEEIHRVEEIVNRGIRANRPVVTEVLSRDEAMKKGAIALFGEKYGERVRVVSIPGLSMELCGGTHMRQTGGIGLFRILAESGIQAGVRRIEAVTGRVALEALHAQDREWADLAAGLKCPRSEVVHRVARLRERVKELEKELEKALTRTARFDIEAAVTSARLVRGIRVVASTFDASDPKTLRETADRVRDRLGTGIAVLGAAGDGKALLVASVSKDLVSRIHAGELMKRLARIVGGSGGGRPDFAQAGGPEGGKLAEAMDCVPAVIEEILAG